MWYDSMLDFLKLGAARTRAGRTWHESWWEKAVFSSSAFLFGSAQKQRPYRRRLLLEVLEDRCVPTTITPTTFADGVLGSGSLRDAVLQFNTDLGSGDDTIQLLSGTYALTIQNTGGRHETAGLEGDLNITSTSHRLIVQGAGSSGDNATIIDASQLQDRVFEIAPGTQVVFRDLVIQGALAEDDGSDSAQAGTTDALGGGLLNNGGNVTLDNVVVQNNVAWGGDAGSLGEAGHSARGGGVYSTGGALTIRAATLANNQASGGRGGDYTRFHSAGDGGWASGAGLYAAGGSLDISDSMVAGNRATGGRGGDGNYSFSSSGFIFRNGGTGGMGLGGGLYVNGSALTISTSTIASNQGTGGLGGAYGLASYGDGAGLYNGGTLTVSNSTLTGNSATRGGGIDNTGTLTVSNGTLSGNTAYGGGGGIANSGTLTVTNSALSGNAVTGNGGGGGIANSGTLTVSNSALSGNSATSAGGGIANDSNGTLTVSNSTLSGNSATYAAGGIANTGTLTVSNSTLSSNSAPSGGGIYNSGRHSVTLTSVTVTANRTADPAYDGGGLYVFPGSSVPVLHNTLIAGNFKGAAGTTRDDVFGRLDPNGDYNLIGDGTGMTGLSNGVNGNLVGSAGSPIDPLLGPLQDYGGPTLTHALMPGSPAIDAGNNAYATDWDQRGEGFPRIVNGVIDIGAFEYQGDGAAPLFTRSVRGNQPAAGAPFNVTVQPVDAFGQVAFGYRGTVTFRVMDTDPAVVLPLDYTVTPDDQGRHTFSGAFTLITAGDQTLTVADLANGLSMDVTLTVTP
jgi:hypothetical protein